MIAELMSLYPGTTESYWLDEQTIGKCSEYLRLGREMEELKAERNAWILLGVVASVFTGKAERPEIVTPGDGTPDRRKLHDVYGDGTTIRR